VPGMVVHEHLHCRIRSATSIFQFFSEVLGAELFSASGTDVGGETVEFGLRHRRQVAGESKLPDNGSALADPRAKTTASITWVQPVKRLAGLADLLADVEEGGADVGTGPASW
jgi:hypothetical protein